MGKNKNDLNSLGEILERIALCLKVLFTGVFMGIYHFPKDKLWAHFGVYFGMAGSCFFATHKQHLLSFTGWTQQIGKITDPFVYKIYDGHDVYYFLILLGLYLALYFFCIGGVFILNRKQMQNKLDQVGIKNGTGQLAKIKSIVRINSMQRIITLYCPGVSIKDTKDKKGKIASAMEMPVEEIKSTHNPALVEIYLSKRTLPKVMHYSEHSIYSPYTFRVGEAREGLLEQDITKLPHMLIAGTTGGGKSMFFRQALLGLLESSSNIQMYLLDLKQGVEMSDFAILPHVEVAKDENQAVTALENIVNEMLRRFNILAEKGKKSIDCKRDQVDRIIVGIDEASVLFAKSAGRSKNDNELSARARELTHKIAKLGRAAGIHLVLATQKVTKDTIDTHIQDNIEGRMIFRMHTPFGSQNVLNAADANKLPNIAGRGIWKCGPLLTTVQAPFISENEMTHRLKQVKGLYEVGDKKNQQEVIYVPITEAFVNELQSGFPVTQEQNESSQRV